MTMPLEQQKFILFDVQTTGTQAASSHIIEAGWGIFAASDDPAGGNWCVQRVKLPDSVKLPMHIQKLTGLKAADFELENCLSYEAMVQGLRDFLASHDAYPILMHYARFKRPFLLQAIEDSGSSLENSAWPSLSDRVVCTFDLAKKNIPHLKSYSLRAVAGYAGYSMGEKKRSQDHLRATAFIWKYLVGQTDNGPAPTSLPLHSPELRQKRLALPDQPGVYYFLDSDQRILYVGKANSLKQRLNSYFRGKKTKGSRLNEMLTRAVDFQFQTVDSELAALFLESDEIKRIDPPYNRLLRAEARTPYPYRHLLAIWSENPLARLLSFVPRDFFPTELVAAAVNLIFPDQDPTAEDWKNLGLALWQDRKEEEGDEEETEDADDRDYTAEDVVAFLQKSLVHGLRQLHRTRWIVRLFECEIVWNQMRISVQSGRPRINPEQKKDIPAAYARTHAERQQGIDIGTYDRLSILLAELRKGLRRGDTMSLCLRPGLVLDTESLKRHLL